MDNLAKIDLPIKRRRQDEIDQEKDKNVDAHESLSFNLVIYLMENVDEDSLSESETSQSSSNTSSSKPQSKVPLKMNSDISDSDISSSYSMDDNDNFEN